MLNALLKNEDDGRMSRMARLLFGGISNFVIRWDYSLLLVAIE